MILVVSQKELAAHYFAARTSLDASADTHVEEVGHHTDEPVVLITETVFTAFLQAPGKVY